MQTVSNSFQSFLDRAKSGRFYWGNHAPDQFYTINPDSAQRCGIAALAKDDLATFNIWLYLSGLPSPEVYRSMPVMASAVIKFNVAKQFAVLPALGGTLGDLAWTSSFEQFDTYVKKHQPTIKTHLGPLKIRFGLLSPSPMGL